MFSKAYQAKKAYCLVDSNSLYLLKDYCNACFNSRTSSENVGLGVIICKLRTSIEHHAPFVTKLFIYEALHDLRRALDGKTLEFFCSHLAVIPKRPLEAAVVIDVIGWGFVAFFELVFFNQRSFFQIVLECLQEVNRIQKGISHL